MVRCARGAMERVACRPIGGHDARRRALGGSCRGAAAPTVGQRCPSSACRPLRSEVSPGGCVGFARRESRLGRNSCNPPAGTVARRSACRKVILRVLVRPSPCRRAPRGESGCRSAPLARWRVRSAAPQHRKAVFGMPLVSGNPDTCSCGPRVMRSSRTSSSRPRCDPGNSFAGTQRLWRDGGGEDHCRHRLLRASRSGVQDPHADQPRSSGSGSPAARAFASTSPRPVPAESSRGRSSLGSNSSAERRCPSSRNGRVRSSAILGTRTASRMAAVSARGTPCDIAAPGRIASPTGSLRPRCARGRARQRGGSSCLDAPRNGIPVLRCPPGSAPALRGGFGVR
jgi:hypothetical protein